jgi:DUF4097 and DUF4098 domain-containing protein YvlB
MNVRIHPQRVPIIAFFLIFAATAGLLSASEREGTFERTLTVNGPADVDVTTGSGNIDVLTGDNATVRVRGTIHVNRWVSADVAARKIQEIQNDPPIKQNGNFIRIGHMKDPELQRHVSISYELTVPADTRLKSNTGSGDLSVAGLKGMVRATTGSGNMRLSNLSNETRVNAGSGDIEIASVSGNVYATTGSGNIRATAISSTIRASTGSGGVKLAQSAQGDADLDTGSGDVEVSGAAGALRAHTGSGNITASGSPGGHWKLNTGSGNVNLKISSQAAFTLNAHTGSGSIESDQPVVVQGKVGKSELRGTVRGGGATVDVSTGSGDIRIE